MHIGSLLDWIKLPPRYLFALLLVTGILVFSPRAFLEALGLYGIVDSYRAWIGFAFLIFFAVLIAHFVSWLGKIARSWVVEYYSIRHGRKRLHDLTDDEKKLLAEYLGYNTRSRFLDFQSGVVNGLVKENVLWRAASSGNLLRGIAYNIQPWAWEYLKQHPELFEPYLTLMRPSSGRR